MEKDTQQEVTRRLHLENAQTMMKAYGWNKDTEHLKAAQELLTYSKACVDNRQEPTSKEVSSNS